ncbi:MAG TPA: hypothetical protein PK539_04765 [Candidatus Paceibacterota bacterium]|nr:hypothetical protein [Candidatus Paceibacterota bacterium]
MNAVAPWWCGWTTTGRGLMRRVMLRMESEMIVFENPGEIDVAAISTFGVSVKDGENPIGFFGTGLKYAIAVLLRNNHKITIWSGLQKYDFSKEKAVIRGQEFELVTINGERMGFTTQVGKTWELWMAYRELFCNTRDEYGDASKCKDTPKPEAGKTFVMVEGNAFEAIHAARWEYLIEDEADMRIGDMEIFSRPSTSFFYRGVRVARLHRQSVLTYNATAQMELTEDRTVKNHYEINYRIVRALLQSEDETLLRRVLVQPESVYEHHLDYHGWSGTPASPVFMKVVGDLYNASEKNLNKTAVQVWRDANPKVFTPTPLDLTAVQKKTLDRAIEFCGRIGFQVDEYPIIVCETLGEGGLGRAYEGRIFVAERTFHLGGVKQVASTLIEEFVHLKHGYDDMTRELQSFLFDKLCSMGEELIGEPA